MKNIIITISLCLLAACAGTRARNTALRPVLLAIWPRVSVDVERGIADAQARNAITPGIAADLRERAAGIARDLPTGVRDLGLPSEWSLLEPYGTRGVQILLDKGELTPATARPVFQRLLNFRDSLDELAGGEPRMPAGMSTGTYRWRDSNGRVFEAKHAVGEPVYEANPLSRLGVKL